MDQAPRLEKGGIRSWDPHYYRTWRSGKWLSHGWCVYY